MRSLLRTTLLLSVFPLVSACREPVPTAPPKTPVKPMAPDGDPNAPADTPKPETPAPAPDGND